MNGSVFIHVGYHKAASTYLQKFVFPVIEANYVFLAGYKRHVLDMVQSETCDDRGVKNWIEAEIRRKYGNNPYPATVLSHEELSGMPCGYKTVNPMMVADNLRRLFPQAKILIVVRNQFSYLRSIYTYRVAIKGEESRSFAQFLEEEGALGLWEKLEYDKLVSYYISLFGKDAVCVLPLELLKKDTGEFCRKLSLFLRVPVSPSGGKVVNESTKLLPVLRFWRPVNFLFARLLLSLKALGIETKEEYPYQRLRYTFYGIKKVSTRWLNRLFCKAKTLDMQFLRQDQELVTRYAASNGRLGAQLHMDLGELGYPVTQDQMACRRNI